MNTNGITLICNNYYNNTNNVVNYTAGSCDTFLDPMFRNKAAGDFTITNSALFGKGFPRTLAGYNTNINQGAIQNGSGLIGNFTVK